MPSRLRKLRNSDLRQMRRLNRVRIEQPFKGVVIRLVGNHQYPLRLCPQMSHGSTERKGPCMSVQNNVLVNAVDEHGHTCTAICSQYLWRITPSSGRRSVAQHVALRRQASAYQAGIQSLTKYCCMLCYLLTPIAWYHPPRFVPTGIASGWLFRNGHSRQLIVHRASAVTRHIVCPGPNLSSTSRQDAVPIIQLQQRAQKAKPSKEAQKVRAGKEVPGVLHIGVLLPLTPMHGVFGHVSFALVDVLC